MSEATIRFLTPAELRASVPPEPDWTWQPYLAAGILAILAGKPKVGKSTLALAVARAVARGATAFLKGDVRGGPVMYVSEEGASTLLHKLPDDEPNLHLLTREGAWPRPSWSALVAAAVAHASAVGARLLVIDTFSWWNDLTAEQERDAGAVQAAMRRLTAATNAGLAVLLVHHQRKAGGEEGDALRGSGALAGAADTLLELERPGEDAPARQRQLVALGRHPQTHGVLLVDYDPKTDSWATAGRAEDRREGRAASRRAVLLEAIPEGEALTRHDLEEATGRQWRDLLPLVNELVNGGQLEREGHGRKGDPYRYRKLWADSVEPTPQNPTETGDAAVPDSVGVPVGDHRTETASAQEPWEVWPHRNGAPDLPLATEEQEQLAARCRDLLGEETG